MDRAGVEPPVVDVFHTLVRILLTTELYINVPHKMVSKVVTHIHFFDLAILILQFREYLFEKFIIMLLHLDITQSNVRTISCLRTILRIQVQVGDTHCLAKSGFVMET